MFYHFKVIDNAEAVLMPIKFMLRKYLESEGVLQAVLDTMKLSTEGVFKSLIDGSIWQTRTANKCCETVIPINVFVDDFVTGDTTSHHAKSTSICGIYINVPCLPAYLHGKLSNILTAGFVKSQHRKKYSNDQVLKPLINVLTDLETAGLEITLNGQKQRIFFVLGFVLGDNLGVNGILDFVECFRANFYCRACKRFRGDAEIDFKEYFHTLRTVINYESDIRLNSVSKTGLKGPSIFNTIPSFHVTHNFVFDIMHDLFEGACVYDLQHMLYHFVFVKQYLTVDELNKRKKYFCFGKYDTNIWQDISEQNVKMKKLRFTATETKTFVKLLPLLLGPLIPEEDEVWQLVCILIKIVCITLLREIPYALINELRSLIESHHLQYVNLFNDTLKPKHHNITHYPTAILKGGPLRNHWSMRFESKHREAKMYGKVNNNRINTCYSMALKANFKFAHNILNNSFFSPKIIFDEHDSKLIHFPEKHEHLVDVTLCNINKQSTVFLKQITKQGSVYQKGTTFFVRHKNIMSIFMLEDIFLNRNNKIFIICKRYRTSTFDDHLQSYKIKSSVIEVITNLHLHESKPIDLYSINDVLYLRMCDYYDCKSNIYDLYDFEENNVTE